MRVAVVSDIHSNLAALEVVVHYINTHDVELTLHLGDIVGYYCKPNEVVALLSELHLISVMGNHDMSIAGGVYEKHFSPDFMASLTEGFMATSNFDALEAIGWTLQHMNRKIADFLIQDTSRIVEVEKVKISMAHGMPPAIRNNAQDGVGFYLYEEKIDEFHDQIISHLASNNCPIMLTGHTHIPVHKILEKNGVKYHLVNPGSVGQPRDGDKRASFAILTLEDGQIRDIENVRLDYNIELTYEMTRREELPIALAERLLIGR